MGPKKGWRRKEEPSTERGKRKMIIRENESSDDDSYPPPGFDKLGRGRWADKRRKPQSGALRTPVRAIRSSGEVLQEPKMLRRSSRLGSLSLSPANNPSQDLYLSYQIEKIEHSININSSEEKHCDSASSIQPNCVNTPDWINPVLNPVQQNTEEKSCDSASSIQPNCVDTPDWIKPVQDPVQPNTEQKISDSASSIPNCVGTPDYVKLVLDPVQPNTEEKISNLASFIQPECINTPDLIKPLQVLVQPNTEDVGKAHSITLTEMARADDCFPDDEVECDARVTIAGYIIKEEFAPTARIIITKYGDILGRSSFEGSLGSDLFEKVCALYQKLEKANLKVIKMADLESMKKDVRDFLKVKVDVGWLAKRLDEIHHAKDILLAAPKMKEQRIKKQKMISEFEKKVGAIQSELNEAKKKVDYLQSEVDKAKMVLEYEAEDAARLRSAHIVAKGEVMRFYNKSLVEGI